MKELKGGLFKYNDDNKKNNNDNKKIWKVGWKRECSLGLKEEEEKKVKRCNIKINRIVIDVNPNRVFFEGQ
jgi:hypothetical protein